MGRDGGRDHGHDRGRGRGHQFDLLECYSWRTPILLKLLSLYKKAQRSIRINPFDYKKAHNTLT